jgi:hypothetical protein
MPPPEPGSLRIPSRAELGQFAGLALGGLRRYSAVGVSLLLLFAMVLAAPAVEPTSVEDPASAQGPDLVDAPSQLGLPDEDLAADGSGAAAGAVSEDLVIVGDDGDLPLPDNCDPETGRVKLPSIFAPPCVYPVADNGGATHMGVTATSIRIVVYAGQSNPALSAILRTVGVDDTAEDVVDTAETYIDMFTTVYETYGRVLEFDVVEASGEADDDEASRRDAIRAEAMEPFLVEGSAAPSAFIDELAARGIPVLTQLQRPNNYFAERSPYIWGSQMDSTKVFLLLAEYIGKRLAGDKARHAGSDELRASDRKFGLIYLDDNENAFRPGVVSFEEELAKYGVTLTDKVAYEFDLDRSQEQARTIMSRFKDRGVTSILFNGDFLTPIFLTREATRQNYFPEWVLSGGTLVDTIFVGRHLYDPPQWRNAFGFSQLWPRPPQEITEPFFQHVWWAGYEPEASNVYEIIYQPILILFTGLHMAGPNLTPATFRDGLFSYPPGGVGAITQVQRSFGNHGYWPFTDYTGFDSVVEVWWDPEAYGEAEQGDEGYGMWQFMDGGRRYTPGQWPSTPPAVGVREGAVTAFDDLPPSDRYPIYDRP